MPRSRHPLGQVTQEPEPQVWKRLGACPMTKASALARGQAKFPQPEKEGRESPQFQPALRLLGERLPGSSPPHSAAWEAGQKKAHVPAVPKALAVPGPPALGVWRLNTRYLS